jgi:hypothetical protein
MYHLVDGVWLLSSYAWPRAHLQYCMAGWLVRSMPTLHTQSIGVVFHIPVDATLTLPTIVGVYYSVSTEYSIHSV